MKRLFGTDGVRGLANRDITADLAVALGEAAARTVVREREADEAKPRVVIGRDTRISGEFLDHALAAGLAAAGMDVIRVGVVPTPAIAHLAATENDVDLGVMISASHNAMPDNGIKFFAKGGYKLPDEVEDEIEAALDEPWERPIGAGVGEVWYDDDMAEKSYLAHLDAAAGSNLRGLRITLDCANGAASELGPEALRRAGAEVVVINASPDGRNINDHCGSTHPQQLQAATVASQSDFGIAYDGDADRCIAVDSDGELVDGDKIMGALAKHMKAEGSLVDDTLVVTVMSNLGLLNAMREAGIEVVQSQVGDRYVLEEMRKGGLSLGGEQSGHVIVSEYSTTGDGILTSLLLARMVQQTGRSLKELVAEIPRLPQTLVNVENVDRAGLDHPNVQAAVEKVETLLEDRGRVLLRASGTEPLVRVMVEAPTEQQAEGMADIIAQSVRDNLTLG